MSTVPMLIGCVIEMIAPLPRPVAWNTAVSCAKGRLLMAGVPPPDVAQPTAVAQLPPAARFQNFEVPAGNVIPLLPLQSPKRVPLTGAAAPAIVMSRKSISVSEATAAQVSVRVAPMVLARTNVRIVALAPAESVSVPLMTWLLTRETVLRPKPALAATVRLLNVLAPDMDTVVMAVLVKATL